MLSKPATYRHASIFINPKFRLACLFVLASLVSDLINFQKQTFSIFTANIRRFLLDDILLFLGISLLERLMNLPPYSTSDPNYITMLKLNFRSHSTILKLPNELFYNGQLQVHYYIYINFINITHFFMKSSQTTSCSIEIRSDSYNMVAMAV